MADTEHVPGAAPVEGDGVNYSGIGWFLVILTATTLFCQALVWGAFELMETYHVERSGIVRPPLSQPAATPSIGEAENQGRLMTGLESPPSPGMVVNEPSVLAEFRRQEDATLSTYGWVNKPLGIVRVPIERAKDLIIERGLTARPAPASGAPAAPAMPAAPAKPAAAPSGH